MISLLLKKKFFEELITLSPFAHFGAYIMNSWSTESTKLVKYVVMPPFFGNQSFVISNILMEY